MAEFSARFQEVTVVGPTSTAGQLLLLDPGSLVDEGGVLSIDPSGEFIRFPYPAAAESVASLEWLVRVDSPIPGAGDFATTQMMTSGGSLAWGGWWGGNGAGDDLIYTYTDPGAAPMTADGELRFYIRTATALTRTVLGDGLSTVNGVYWPVEPPPPAPGGWRVGRIGFIPDTPVGDICPSLVYSGDELSDWAYQGFQTQLVAGEILAVDWNQKQVLRFEVTSATTMSRSTVFDLGAGDTYLYHLTADDSTAYSLVVDQSGPTTNTWALASLTLDGGSTYSTIASVVTKKSEGSITSWEPFAWAQPAAVPADDDHLWVWQLESDGTNRRARMLGIHKGTGSTVYDVLFPYSLTNIITDLASWAVTHDRIWIPRLGAGGTISQFDVTTQTWHEISPLGGTERIYGDQLLPDADRASVKATLRTGTSDASRGLVRIAEDGTVTELDCEPEFDNSSSSTRNATAVTSAYGSWRWESGSLVSVLSTDGNWNSLYGWD